MRNFFLIGTFIISLFVASCNKENIPDKGSIKGERITVSANISKDAQSKLNYTDDETNKLFTMDWSVNESFVVYNGTSSEGEKFSNGNNGGSKFEGTAPAGTDKYYAVYGCADTSNTNGVLTVDIANQNGDTTENGIRSFMVAESDNLDSTTTFKFNHKLVILKLNLTFPAGTTGIVKEVIIGGLHNKANYTLATDKYEDYTAENKKYIKATNNGSGFTIEKDKITAYISVFPEAVKAKQVTITAVIEEGTEAVDYSYTMQNAKTLKVGTLLPVSVTLVKMEDNFKSAYTQTDYYMWDAYEPYKNIASGTWEEGSSWYNPTTDKLASASCKDCPTAEQMVAYLKAGVYWDDNTTVAEGKKTYTLDGNTTESYSTGLWVKKRRYIDNFDSETEKTYSTTPKKLGILKDEEVKNIRTGGEYFFLPACGRYYSGSIGNAGTLGYYWSSTPSTSNSSYAYYLNFNSGNADVLGDGYSSRNLGFVPMPCL